MRKTQLNVPRWRRKVAQLIMLLCDIPKIVRAPRLSRLDDNHVREIEPPAGVVLTNPTIALSPVGSLTIYARQVSYVIDWRGRYLHRTGDHQGVSSLTWRAETTARLDESIADVKLVTMHMPPLPPGVELEDPRFAGHSSSGDLVVWSMKDARSNPASTSMCVGTVSPEGEILSLVGIDSPHGRHIEKNWMPYQLPDGVHFVYDAASAERYRVGTTGLEPDGQANQPTNELERRSGSSQLIPWRDGWLCVVHWYALVPLPFKVSAWRFYLHQFLYFSHDFGTSQVSRSFCFDGPGIEFCGGISSHDGRILLSYGVRDRRAKLISVDESVVTAFLKFGA